MGKTNNTNYNNNNNTTGYVPGMMLSAFHPLHLTLARTSTTPTAPLHRHYYHPISHKRKQSPREVKNVVTITMQ